MNRAELAELLEEEGYRSSVYSLGGGLCDDRLCLDEVHGNGLFIIASAAGDGMNESSPTRIVLADIF